jgi:hypothetical protein
MNQELQLRTALESIGALSKRLDGIARADSAKPDDKRRDAAEDGQLLAILTKILAHLERTDAKRDDAAAEPEEMTGDDNRADDDDRRKDDDDRHHRRDDDDDDRHRRKDDDDRHRRKDARADSLRLAEFQNKVFDIATMHGVSLERPRIGDSFASYRLRTLRQMQRLLPDKHGLKRADLSLVRDERSIDSLKDDILRDTESAAWDPSFNTPGGLRQITRHDQAGRAIHEFVGKPSAWMDQFKAPRLRLDLQALRNAVKHYETLEAMRGRG